MADKCGSCDCADKTQCVKKGSQYGFDIIESNNYADAMVMDVSGSENDGKCKCGTSCGCTNCTCGCH